jgi:hypothetical protein
VEEDLAGSALGVEAGGAEEASLAGVEAGAAVSLFAALLYPSLR